MSLETHRAESDAALGVAIVTFSDTRSLAEDRGGDYLAEACAQAGHRVVLRELTREDDAAIEAAVRAAAAAPGVQLVLTTGGTGIAPRDRTYDVLRRVLDSEIPGFGELFRWLSYAEVGSATILSRALGGVLEGRVVLAMPGSTKALRLAMEKIVLPEAGHLVSQVGKTAGA
ncbi:MAG: molybdenum cofactor biosynthesis protein MoaB [Planctomycetes bacterium]|nr:molybdenum cofactor biosynthesis protein MoaB [Planctomycetota bacterium]